MFGRRPRTTRLPASSALSSEFGLDPERRQAAAQARGIELFDLAQAHFRAGKFEKAADTFAAAEAEIKGVPGLVIWEMLFRIRRGFSLFRVRRLDEAFEIFDGLVADQKKLKAAELDVFPRDRWPDELPALYWSRAMCLNALGRLVEARDALPDLIEEIGSGTTPTQREYLGGAYLLQAKVAESEGDYEQALHALDSVLAHCRRYDEEWVDQFRQPAERRKKILVKKAN